MTNPPIFPDLEGYVSTKGPKVTLRDWFAGMALQGMCANPDITAAMSEQGMKPHEIRDSFASSAYAQANEMIAKRDESIED